MKIVSVKDELELDGENIIIRKRGAGNALASGINGDRLISVRSINAIQVKLGGWTPGYIQFSYAGSKPFNGGVIAATQDPDAFVFEKALNNKIQEMELKIKEIMRSPKTQPKGSIESSLSDELRKLGNLKNEGLLSEAEFEIAKRKLLS